MSSWYFVTPYDPKAWEDPDDTSEKPTSDLKIVSKDFREALLEHWGADRMKDDYYTTLLNNSWELINPNDTEGGALTVHLRVHLALKQEN